MSEKVVIIGGGLGGLSTGLILQKNGYDVTVLEMGLQIGGCLQCFTRRGAKFETGMHFIGSAAPGQTMDRIFRYFGLSDDVRLSSLDPEAYNVVDLDGDKFSFPTGREAFIERMGGYFPHQKDAIANYVKTVDRICAASSLNSFAADNRDMVVDTEYQTRAMDEVLGSIFTDPLLANVIAGDLPLYAAEAGKTPFSQHAFIMDFYNNSAYRVVGGSDAIANSLQRQIENAGGRVLIRRRAVKIHCNDIKATAVETEDGDIFNADWVIGAIHPKRLLELLDTRLIRPAFRSRINSIPESQAVFALYVRFRDGAMPYMNSNSFCYNSSTPWNCEIYDEGNWPKGFLYMQMCHEDGARFAKSGVVLSYMNMSEVAKWKGTPVGRRGQDYEDFKKDRALRLIAAMERHYPGFAASIESWFSSTPLTYLDYTGTEDGGMYGVAKDIHLGAAGRVPYRTKVPNLLLSGQNVNSHGILGVIVGTVVTCSALLPPGRIYEQISRL
ncbi:MAG: phytoene desaturase family protein [Candidatus Cryptobacteroides sp.]